MGNILEFFEDDTKADVRIHGNGFLQAELPNGCKMHVWKFDTNMPRQKVATHVHNHTSPFRSTIVYGTLRNTEYAMQEIDTTSKYNPPCYDEYEARVRHDKDTGLYKTGRQFFPKTQRIFRFAEGSRYSFPGTPDLFHWTYAESELVVTMVERAALKESSLNPIVMVPVGKEPDNYFDRYAHSEYAMKLYSEVKNLLSK